MTPTLTRGGSLTAEQMDTYDREGYIVIDHLLDRTDMKAPISAMQYKVSIIADALYDAGLITDKFEELPFETRLAQLFARQGEKEFLYHGGGWRDRFPGYFELMSNPKILDAVESLIGGELFSNPVYNVRPKVPRVAFAVVPWHQDKSYWPDANANPVITVWIPMVDSTEENGCIHLIPRTHKRRMLSYHQEKSTGMNYTEIDEHHLAEGRLQEVALPMAAGSALLFNDRIVHMSTPNTSDHVRWSVDLRYQPTDQERMPQHGVGFLARSYLHPERVATLDYWLAGRPEHDQ